MPGTVPGIGDPSSLTIQMSPSRGPQSYQGDILAGLFPFKVADTKKEKKDGVACEPWNSCCSGLIFLLQRSVSWLPGSILCSWMC